MTDPLEGRRIALGVTGSIAAYKSLSIASELTAAGALVDVLMTRSAQSFVGPISFQALTHRPVVSDLFAPTGALALDHVSIAREAQVFVVAPATADVLARLNLGRADDPVTATALATRAPMVVAPAMEPHMWSHEATQRHVASLRARHVAFVGPEPGRMASGDTGVGRMAAPATVVETLRVLAASLEVGALSGRHVVVTAGPTIEAVDPVRVFTNRSTGTMGLALARAARDRGARVTLIAGPMCHDAPLGVERVDIETASQMCAEVLARVPGADVLLMAAAVADYTVAAPRDRKIKKQPGDLSLSLQRTKDVLVELDNALADHAIKPLRVGFAAESGDLVSSARAKLEAKGLDLVVANPVPASFGTDAVSAHLVGHDRVEEVRGVSKQALADMILDRAVTLMADGVVAAAETGAKGARP